MSTKNTPAYFTKLELENIRSFGQSQCLSLVDEEGRPAQWTVILGDNGVGKTTLLQCLVRMCPQFNKEPDEGDGPPPNLVEPELAQEVDNRVLNGFVRSGADSVAKLCAELVTGKTFDGSGKKKSGSITTSITITRKRNKITGVEPTGDFSGKQVEPLVLAYGAGRHMGTRNLERLTSLGSTESLFDVSAELFDAEEMLYQLDYLQLKDRPDAESLLGNLKRLLADILPALDSPNDIDIRGPRLSGSKEENEGVWVKISSGNVQFERLSLGYQTVVAWTADIAWRMLNHYPKSQDPLLEPAIVIVDEIDLHLHPQWQRTIRDHLIHHFPAAQFIATAHSPLIAQDALYTNLAVIHDQDGQAVIESEPVVVNTWRLDQILTSDLFGVESARSVKVEQAMNRRIELVQKKKLSKAEQTELDELDLIVAGLPTAETKDDQTAMDIVREAASLLSSNKQ